jgi:hypothetical protein
MWSISINNNTNKTHISLLQTRTNLKHTTAHFYYSLFYISINSTLLKSYPLFYSIILSTSIRYSIILSTSNILNEQM